MTKEKEKDPLLGDDESQTPSAGKPVSANQSEPAAKPAAKVDTAKINADTVANTKAILAKQPKVNFIIPLAPDEPPGSYDTVQINGYRLEIKKGEMVEVPQAVAMLLAEKYKIGMTAGQDKRVDSRPDKSDALS